MSNTIMPTVFSSGVRRIHAVGMSGLGGWAQTLGELGDVQDVAQGMIGEGWNKIIINNLVATGVTEAQLQSLWDNFNPDSDGYTAATHLQQQLANQNFPGAGPILSAAGSVAAAIQSATSKVINTALGAFDLATQAGWDGIASQLRTIQQAVNQAAAMAPNAPDTVSNVTQFNSLLQQFGAYYSQVTGKTLTLSGLGIFGVDDAIVAAVIGIIAAAFGIWQWAKVRISQAGVQQTQATSQAAGLQSLNQQYAALNQQAAAAYAAGNKALGDQLSAQANQALSAIQKVGTAPPQGLDFSSWFQQNWGWLMLGLGAIVIVPAVLGGRRR